MADFRILFTGTTGECIPPPYGGIPKRALMLGAFWRKHNNITVSYTFPYHHDKEDDLGAEGAYFFEYTKKPGKLAKIAFIVSYAFQNPKLYGKLFAQYTKTFGRLDRQSILYPAYGVFLDTVYATFKPDIVVAEAALIQTFMAAHVATWRKIPFVIETYAEVHDQSMTKSLKFTDSERDAYWKYFLGLADHIITPSNYCALGPLAYVPQEKTTMVYATSLDVTRFDKSISVDEKNALRQKLGLPLDFFYVMAVGAFTERKGHDHIIEAVVLLHKEHPSIAVVLCGAGNPEWLKKLAEVKGVEQHVFFFQAVTEETLTNLYHAVDLYCDASNTQRACLGIALTDALASRLPTIAYDVAGLPESVHHNKNGLLSPLNDITKLSGAIQTMYQKSITEREELGDKGLAIAKSTFDLPIIAKQLLDTLMRVARSKQ
jgi:glycosyltransferase involved in cell wall biosynthesis